MKAIPRTLCLAALLAGLFCVPAGAAEAPVAVRKLPAPPVVATDAEQADEADDDDLLGQTVYQVLLAEIALRRGDVELASRAYASLAVRTRDPKVIERAVEVAIAARHIAMALEMTRLWLDVAPLSKPAQRMLVGILVLDNRLDEVAPHIARMLASDEEALAGNLLGLNRMFARSPDRQAVFRLVEMVCRPFDGIAEAHYAMAQAAGSAGMTARAKQEVARALELRPDWEMAAYFRAQLLLRESTVDAIAFLEGFVERNPAAHDAQFLLARALVGERRYDDARRHFDVLLKAYPDKPEIIYSVAILALQQNDKARAEEQLKHFVTLNVQDKNPAYYYLGQIAEDDQRRDEALTYYGEVVGGEHYLTAQIRRARLLADQGNLDGGREVLRSAKVDKPEEKVQVAVAEAALLRDAGRLQEAFDLLEGKLGEQPEQPDLMYETALMAERLNRLEVMETRLRRLIELRPDSSQAYNALGYSYADRGERLQEARQLIEKALALSPEDGFILDSMGWVLFRQGDLDAALTYLERSYAKREDPEIAAHLGEVLWALGRQDDARRLLLDAQKKHPNNEVLIGTIRRLSP